MKKFDVVAAVLLVIGGLNWGLVGVANFNLVTAIFGNMTILSRAVFTLVGLAAVYQGLSWKAIQRRWIEQPSSIVSRAA
jgi:uncharacterized membrane protein YuzA (DUF378 family)